MSWPSSSSEHTGPHRKHVSFDEYKTRAAFASPDLCFYAGTSSAFFIIQLLSWQQSRGSQTIEISPVSSAREPRITWYMSHRTRNWECKGTPPHMLMRSAVLIPSKVQVKSAPRTSAIRGPKAAIVVVNRAPPRAGACLQTQGLLWKPWRSFQLSASTVRGRTCRRRMSYRRYRTTVSVSAPSEGPLLCCSLQTEARWVKLVNLKYQTCRSTVVAWAQNYLQAHSDHVATHEDADAKYMDLALANAEHVRFCLMPWMRKPLNQVWGDIACRKNLSPFTCQCLCGSAKHAD